MTSLVRASRPASGGRRKLLVGGLRLIATAGAVFACAAAVAETFEVRIEDYRYAPPELSVKKGSTVKWLNAEKRTSHSILFTGPGGFESERIFPGESWSRQFDAAGRYPYTCGPHPEMKGLIVVTD